MLAVLNEVRAACDKLPVLRDAHAHVRGKGWTRVEDAAATPVGPLVAMGMEQGRALAKAQGGSIEADRGAYRKIVAGEELWLLLSGATIGGQVVHGCRVYDPGETRRITVKDVSAWLGREPVQTVDRPELLRGEWQPGINAGQDSFELFFVPDASPLRELIKLSGVAIKADWVGAPAASSPTSPQEKK
ncbi:hypothetical protein [Sphingomonas lenta]|uniref:Uncharacterized protein n=1 Tax=Sphingomonas lenta TaxID=1141887 RepID=A0A2A2SG83_9SPHN|nr:hypothetical protein [Sphingomonas lenta]PAX08200.1 hypothetical protein CKY28_11550 [Sphingomonas lenta]